MTDDDNIPTAAEGEMPEAHGDNFAKSEKALGREAYKIGRHAEKLLDKHDKIVTEVHKLIIEFGLKLQTGRDLYEFDDTGYNEWIVRSKLDTIRIGATQQERTACRTIARLHETGYLEDPDADNGAALKLNLTECKRVRPTDIIKWARGCQPLLFDDLRAKAMQPKKSKTPPLPSDDVPDLVNGGPDKGAPELEGLRSRMVAILRGLSKDERMRDVERTMKALNLNIHDWVSTMTIGRTDR